MLTLKVKLLAFLVTSANIVLLPNLPQLQITISSNETTQSPLSLFSLFSTSSIDACKPDLLMTLGQNFHEIPETFETCAKEISALAAKTHPDSNKTTSEVIEAYGYPLETHKVITEDGYILTLHRIPRKGGIPVYLQHGLGGCSDNWVLQYRDKSLAFYLADNDYDVWLASSRGTTYSLEHKTLQWDNPFDYSYWDFSFHEIGVFDVPAITDYIIAVTGKPKIFYIGHSMGTSTYLVALDHVPQLNDKILAGILLAPAGFVSRSPSPFRAIAKLIGADPFIKYLEPIFKGRVDFQRKNEIFQVIRKTMGDICTPTALRCTACDEFIFATYGINAPQINYTNIPNVFAKYPNIVSVKTAFHYAQLVNHCSFRQFDYGPIKNLMIYNSLTPPDYTLQNIKVPTYSFYGQFDNLCRPKDVKRTLDLLPEGILKANVPVNSTYFNHVDFLLAKDALTLFYTNILKILKDNHFPDDIKY